MKNYLRFLSPVLLLIMAVMLGGGKILAQTQWKLVTSNAELVDGAEYLIVSQNNGTYYALAKPKDNNFNFSVVEVSLNSNSITVDAATDKNDEGKPFAVTLKKSGSYWNFFEKLNSQYINGGAKYKDGKKDKNNNYFKLDNEVVHTTGYKNYNGVWSISVSATDNFAEIKNQNGFIVSFNHGGSNRLIASYISRTLNDSKTYSKVHLFKKVTFESLTTSAGGYATYSADYAVNYSDLGLTAYTLTVDETNKTVTAKAFTGVVPTGGAVLVKGTANTTYTLTPATTEGDATSFVTALQTGATTADGTQYGFTSKSGTPAFAQVKSGQEIPAKKGYIVLNGASAAKYSICFDDEATGIQTIEAASATNAAMYNLAGQRVDKAYKGIVIVNGKKYLNK